MRYSQTRQRSVLSPSFTSADAFRTLDLKTKFTLKKNVKRAPPFTRNRKISFNRTGEIFYGLCRSEKYAFDEYVKEIIEKENSHEKLGCRLYLIRKRNSQTCSMVDYEMFLPRSPPVFSHSPPTSFLSDFQTINLNNSFHRIPKGLTCRQNSFPVYKPPVYTSVALPKRPCLVIRQNEDAQDSPKDEDPTSPTKSKKKVVFADDKGRPLTHVRVMSEPSNVPPLWSMKFLAEVTRGVNAEPEAQIEPWEMAFSQPASDYIAFRNKLETNMVSLENVIVKESEEQIVGTIKVKNISFHKEVFVRHTFNGWKTYEDSFCNYIPNNIVPGTTYVLYDTFSFKINLQPKARKMEFCVCFKCDGREYWDSNDGSNYVINKKALAPLYKPTSDSFNSNEKTQQSKCSDVSRTKLDSWSQFASWNHLDNTTPYW